MKQVSTTAKSSVLTPRPQYICQRSPFSRYCFVFLFGVIVMLAGGCQKPHDHIKKTVPFKAEFATIATIVQEGPPELDSITGQGNGTPVGKSSLVAQSQFDADGNLTGNLAFTTANGDKIFCTDQGQAPDIDKNGDITLHFESTIKGGTGKFAGATGSLSAIALGSIYTSEGSVSFDGTITY